MLTTMISITILLSVLDMSAAHVDVVQYHVHRIIFTSEVRKSSQFENRNFGPA